MSVKARLEIYRLDANGSVIPIDLRSAQSIVFDLVDKDSHGKIIECRPEMLGYFDGEPAYVDRRGILVVNLGQQDTSRLFAALNRLVQQLQVEIWLGDTDLCWTNRVRAGHV